MGVALAVSSAIMLSTVAAAAPSRPANHPACCHVAAGTPVEVELVDQVSSAVQRTGDTFALRLAAPLVVHRKVVLRAGTRGVGEVIESAGPGLGGKPAKMVLAARYLSVGREHVPLSGLQLARPGRDNAKASQILGLSGMAVKPLGVVGIIVPGGEVVFPPGTVATAKVARAVTLPPLAAASQREIAAASEYGADAADVEGPITIPPPPHGKGQVVFYRAKSLLGFGPWFKVREGGKVLGKLSNGTYFVDVTTPGVHTFTARLEPELKDHLKLQVDAGETYFVEGSLTGGLVIGAADLSPSTRARFSKAAKGLKLAGAPGEVREHPAPPT